MKNLSSYLLGTLMLVAPATGWTQSRLSSTPPPSLRQSAESGLGESSTTSSATVVNPDPSFQTEAINIWSENFGGSNPSTRGWLNYGFRGINTGNTPDTNGVWEYRG
ncbi:MAG: hypothetical protein ACK4ZC_00915, partial [Bacteroidota bacterium]